MASLNNKKDYVAEWENHLVLLVSAHLDGLRKWHRALTCSGLTGLFSCLIGCGEEALIPVDPIIACVCPPDTRKPRTRGHRVGQTATARPT